MYRRKRAQLKRMVREAIKRPMHSDPSHGKKSIFDYHGTFRIVVLLKLNRFSESVQKELRVYHFSFVFSTIMKLNVLFSLLN